MPAATLGPDISALVALELDLRTQFAAPIHHRTSAETLTRRCDAQRPGVVGSAPGALGCEVHYTLDALYGDAGLHVEASQLHDIDTRKFDDVCVADLRLTLEGIQGGCAGWHKPDEFVAVGRAVLKRLVDELLQRGAAVEPLFEASRLPFSLAAELCAIPLPDSTFNELDARVVPLVAKMGELERNEDDAEDDEDLKELQDYTQRRVDLTEEVLELLRTRVHALDTAVHKFDAFEQIRLQKGKEIAEATTAELQQRYNLLKERCERDMGRVYSFGEQVRIEHESALQAWRSAELSYEKGLEQNAIAQRKCWHTIDEAERELTRLAQQRSESMSIYMQELATERERLEHHRRCVALLEHHSQYLRVCADRCGDAVRHAIDVRRVLVRGTYDFIEARRAASVKKLEALRKPFQAELYGYLHQQFLSLEALAKLGGTRLRILQRNAEDQWHMQWLTQPHRDRHAKYVQEIRDKQQQLLQRHRGTLEFLAEHKIAAKSPEFRIKDDDVDAYMRQMEQTLNKHDEERFLVPGVDPPLESSIPTMPKLRQDMLSPKAKEDRRKHRSREGVVGSPLAVAAPLPSSPRRPGTATLTPRGALVSPVVGRMPHIQSPRLHSPGHTLASPHMDLGD